MIKKRYVILLCVLLLLVLGSIIAFTKPVLPVIQVPGEVYPGTQTWPIVGPLFGGLTNTFMASLVAYILIIILVLVCAPDLETSEEVPSGFYNFFEMILEVAYNFAERIAGSKIQRLLSLFHEHCSHHFGDQLDCPYSRLGQHWLVGIQTTFPMLNKKPKHWKMPLQNMAKRSLMKN